MKSFESMSSRKAHSATKVSRMDQVFSSCDYKTNIRTSCSSASSYSPRDKRLNTRLSKNILLDDLIEPLRNADCNKNKVFLYASQVLGKLKKVIHASHTNLTIVKDDLTHYDTNSHNKKLKLSFRKVYYYNCLLKRLLEERCVLLLKEESQSCVKQTQNLVSDLKLLYSHEIIKLTTMPIKSYHRFIDSSGISISILQKLFKKVNYICDLHSSLKNNYQNIINFFHVGFDMELHQTLLKVNKLQSLLYSEMFYWTHKILEVFILKLCLADPDLITPEFLRRVVEMCESFNLLLLDKKQSNYEHVTRSYNVLSTPVMESDYEAILLDFILQYLSHVEAKVAAEKIVQCLIQECKNSVNTAFKEQRIEKEKRDMYIPNSSTSDYYSASSTITETPQLVNDSVNFESVFLSFIQRNQFLILKYLYSMMCLDVSTPRKIKSHSVEHYPDSSTATGNKGWALPQTGYKSRSFVGLEEKYWMQFWEKVIQFSLKLILEVPCHQYGNAAAGVFLFWPQSYHYVIFKLLECSMGNKDVSPSGINVTKKVFHTLLIHTIQETWDKNMASALSIIHGQYSVAIPVAENRVRTRIGNALCACLEAFETAYLKNILSVEKLYLQMFYPFQVTLDCFIFITNIKTRTSVSSSDIASYLLITRSDCICARKLLKERVDIFNRSEQLSFFNNQKYCVSNQIEILSGHISEAPILVQEVVFHAVKNVVYLHMNKNHCRICCWNNKLKGSSESVKFFSNSVGEFLNSFIDTIDCIPDGLDILSAVTNAVASALFSVLQVEKKYLNSKKIQVINEILYDFLNWLEQLNIEEFDREKLKDLKCLKKLICITHIIETSSSVKLNLFGKASNKVGPLMPDFTPQECMILTEQERLHWRMYNRSPFSQCF